MFRLWNHVSYETVDALGKTSPLRSNQLKRAVRSYICPPAKYRGADRRRFFTSCL